jgi:hypothetical protein
MAVVAPTPLTVDDHVAICGGKYAGRKGVYLRETAKKYQIKLDCGKSVMLMKENVRPVENIDIVKEVKEIRKQLAYLIHLVEKIVLV